MKKAVSLGMMLIASAGCSGGHNASADANAHEAAKAAEVLKSPQGVTYEVSRVPGVKLDDIPMNSDLKMADRDLAKYAVTACPLDVPPATAPIRCDIYMQPDKNGTLIGYAAVVQDSKGVSFQTITTLNEKKQPGETCSIQGPIAGDGDDYKAPVKDASKNFEGHFMYSAWQKEPGNYLVSPVDDASTNDMTNDDTALGVWYVSKVGDKLRISQERWNYCYRDSSVNVDDVFYRVISLTRKA